MTIIKLAGIAFVFFGCVTFGFSKAKKEDMQVHYAKKSCAMIQDCLISIKHAKLSTGEVMSKLKQSDEQYILLDFFDQLQQDLSVSTSQYLNNRQKQLLNQAFFVLKSGSTDEIVDVLSSSLLELKTIHQTIAEKSNPKSLLYKKLGIIAGLFSCIILI